MVFGPIFRDFFVAVDHEKIKTTGWENNQATLHEAASVFLEEEWRVLKSVL